MSCQLLLGKCKDILDADRYQHAVNRLARSALFKQVEKGKPTFLVAFDVGVLRCVAPGGVDQDGFFRKPPVTIARSADTRDGSWCGTACQRKLQPGIHE